MRIIAASRPFVLTYGGLSFPLTSEDAQRLLDSEDVVRATLYFVTFDGGATLRPATLGGGPAFELPYILMKKRYCEPCDELVKGRECPKCGADTTALPKGVKPEDLGKCVGK